MGHKALIRLLIIFVAVGAVALIFKLTGPGKIETVASSTDREKVFANFPLNDVAQIRIKNIDGELNLEKSAEGWTVSERDGYPANTAAAVNLLRSVWDLKVVQSPEIGPSQYERLSLNDPAKGSAEGSASVISFLDATGKELSSLWLGKVVERESGQPNPYGPSTTEAGRYVKTGNEDTVFLVSETFSDAAIDPSDWLDEDFFEIDKIKTIAIQSETPDADWKLTREEENGDFTLVDAKEGEEVDGIKVGSMKNAFSSPRFEDVIVGEEAKENAPGKTTFVIETFDDLTYTVKLGEKSELNEFFLTYEVTGNFPEKRKPVEEESEEETRERDAMFTEALQVAKGKLAEQQKMAGKVYKVRSYVADPLIKKREEILKSDEPNPGAGGPSFTPGAAPGGGAPMNIPGLPPGIIPTSPPKAEPKPAAPKADATEAPAEKKKKETPATKADPPKKPAPKKAEATEEKPTVKKEETSQPAEDKKADSKPAEAKPAPAKENAPPPADAGKADSPADEPKSE